MTVRFIHTSDLQLGMTRWYLTRDAQHRFTQDRIDVIRRLGAAATENDAQFVVVAGDVFESNQVAAQTVRRSLKALESIPVPVFLLPGNHDPLDAGSVFKHRTFTDHCPGHVRVIQDSKPQPVPGVEQVEVIGAPWLNKHPLSDLVAQMAAELQPALGLRVAVGHGAISTLSPDALNPALIDLDAVQAALAADKFHYLALGDRHSVTELASRVRYSGAPVATDFDEVDPGKCLLVELARDEEPGVTAIPVSDWRFVSRDWDIDGAADIAAFCAWLAGFQTPERTVLQLAFTGTVSIADHAALLEARAQAESLFAGVRYHERFTDLAVMPIQTDATSIGLHGYERAAWQALSDQAQRGDAAAQDALALFYRLASEEA